MSHLRRLRSALRFGHGWIALGAAAQTAWVADRFLEGPDRWTLAGAVGSGAFAIYTVLRSVRARNAEQRARSERLRWTYANQRPLGVLAVLAAIAGLVLLGPRLAECWPVIMIAVLPALLYLHPNALDERGGGLRALPGVKLFVILWCWTLATVVLPIQLAVDVNRGAAVFAYAMVHVPLYFAVAVLFDIRDLPTDPKSLRTVPQLIGLRWSRALAVLFLLFAGTLVLLRGLVSFTTLVDGEVRWDAIGASIGFVVAVAVAAGVNPTRTSGYFECAVDGLLVLIPTLYFVGSMM